MGQEGSAGPAWAAGRHAVVALHAHPDDEAILTGGTLSALARAGHRVVLVTATDGGGGQAAPRYTDRPGGLAERRREELAASAEALGVARTVRLGHPDSGLAGTAPPAGAPEPADPGTVCFAALDPGAVAAEVAAVVREEGARLLLGYDPAGGYGHPDHVQVHRVARLVAEHTGVPLLEATAPREPLAAVARLAGLLPGRSAGLAGWRSGFTPRAAIGYRVDVRAELAAKRRALAAHASQATSRGGGGGPRTLALVSAVPTPVLRPLLGTEYFADPAAPGPRHQTRRVAAVALLAEAAS